MKKVNLKSAAISPAGVLLHFHIPLKRSEMPQSIAKTVMIFFSRYTKIQTGHGDFISEREFSFFIKKNKQKQNIKKVYSKIAVISLLYSLVNPDILRLAESIDSVLRLTL